ncbi:hypothetical protein LSAT2_010774, partial [Lamellibrachia satsuma]
SISVLSTQEAQTYGFMSATRIQRTDKPTYADLRVEVFSATVVQDRCRQGELLAKLAAEASYTGCMQTTFSSDAVALQADNSVGFLRAQNGNVNGRCCDSVMLIASCQCCVSLFL